MSKRPGQAVTTSVTTVTMTTDGTASDGDVVALNGDGYLTQADGTNNTNIIGVLAYDQDDAEAGEKAAVHLDGPVVANVATGTAAGVEVAASGTAGEAAAGAGSINTLSAEGETADFGGAIDAGYAIADL